MTFSRFRRPEAYAYFPVNVRKTAHHIRADNSA